MIIKLTESELRTIIQRVIDEQSMGGMTSPQTFANTSVEGAKYLMELDPHTRNMILGIGLSFFGPVGLLLAAGVGLMDAKMYYDEGDKYTAGLIGMFSLLPSAGLLTKLGLSSKWTAKNLVPIARKIKLGQKLFPEEVEVVNKITKNRQLIQNELKKYADITLQQAKQKARQTATKQTIKKTPRRVGAFVGKNIVAPSVAYDVGYNTLYPEE
jgi:hypothetical protein